MIEKWEQDHQVSLSEKKKISVGWGRFLDWSNVQLSKVQRRARIQLNITSQEKEDECSMTEGRKQWRWIGWSRTESDRRVYEEQQMWRNWQAWTWKKIWNDSKWLISVKRLNGFGGKWGDLGTVENEAICENVHVCMCMLWIGDREWKTELWKNSWWAILGEKVVLKICRWI